MKQHSLPQYWEILQLVVLNVFHLQEKYETGGEWQIEGFERS